MSVLPFSAFSAYSAVQSAVGDAVLRHDSMGGEDGMPDHPRRPDNPNRHRREPGVSSSHEPPQAVSRRGRGCDGGWGESREGTTAQDGMPGGHNRMTASLARVLLALLHFPLLA